MQAVVERIRLETFVGWLLCEENFTLIHQLRHCRFADILVHGTAGRPAASL